MLILIFTHYYTNTRTHTHTPMGLLPGESDVNTRRSSEDPWRRTTGGLEPKEVKRGDRGGKGREGLLERTVGGVRCWKGFGEFLCLRVVGMKVGKRHRSHKPRHFPKLSNIGIVKL